MMGKHRCIYCLQEQDEERFNREHVVPRMMGTYQNGYVLNNYQVCEGCNSYFCNNLENLIALDSYESLLRMQHLSTPMSDGRRLSGYRVYLTGDEGIFMGIPFVVTTDQTSPCRIRFNIPPMVGIIKCPEKQEYNYYSILDLPEATEQVIAIMKSTAYPIVNTGIPKEELESALVQKGYSLDTYKYSEQPMSDVYPQPEILTQIHVKIDAIMRRVCAKTAFNYMCFFKGAEYVLNPQFDAIRKYIRYGDWSEDLWFSYSKGPVSTVEMPNETAHIVGYMWYPENGFWILCGCLTWFGDITYIFKLGQTAQAVQKVNVLDPTMMSCFNNADRTISDDNAVHVYGG